MLQRSEGWRRVATEFGATGWVPAGQGPLWLTPDRPVDHHTPGIRRLVRVR